MKNSDNVYRIPKELKILLNEGLKRQASIHESDNEDEIHHRKMARIEETINRSDFQQPENNKTTDNRDDLCLNHYGFKIVEKEGQAKQLILFVRESDINLDGIPLYRTQLNGYWMKDITLE